MSSHIRTLAVLLAISLALIAAPDAQAGGGRLLARPMNGVRATGRVLKKMVTHPIPLGRGGKLRVNIAPIVEEDDTTTKVVIGLVAATSKTRAHAVAPVLALSADGNAIALGNAASQTRAAIAGFVAAGDTSAWAGMLALSEGDSFGLIGALGRRLAVAGGIAFIDQFSLGTAVGGLWASGWRAIGGVVAKGGELSVGGVAAIDESNRLNGYGALNAVTGGLPKPRKRD